MNKFKTTDNGGLPFVLDDLRWMDASYREAFLGFWAAFANGNADSFILSGCSMADQNVGTTVNEGYIYLYGEICYVPEHEIPAGSGTAHWEIISSYDSTGFKTFADSATHDTYEIRRAQVTKDVFSAGTRMLASDTSTIHDKIVKYSQRKTAVVEIGVWDLTAATIKTVAHGLSLTGKKVLSLEAFIFEDDDIVARSIPLKFDTYQNKASIVSIDSTNVKLQIDSTSPLNSTDYNNNSNSRGYVVITYQPTVPNW